MSQNPAYFAGATDALESFGVRVASDSFSRAMPDGPEHLGAEWLSRKLRNEKNEYSQIVGSKPSHRKLERPASWGSPGSLEGGSANMHNNTGVGRYGGV